MKNIWHQITTKDDLFIDFDLDAFDWNIRVSPHSFFFQINSTFCLLINSVTNAIDIVDESIALNLKEKKWTKIPEKLIHNLYIRGHIINDSYQNFINAKRNEKNNRKIALLQLCPTYTCNFKCVYCYQKKGGGKENFFGKTSRIIIEKYIDEFLFKNKRQYMAYYLSLFGGEPLQAKNRNFIKWVFELCKRKSLKLIITTNGFDLIDYIDLFLLYREYIYNIGTSVDGLDIRHDERRRPPFGTSPGSGFKRIIRGIEFCLGLNIPITVSMNIDKKNIQDLKPVFNFFSEKGWFEKPHFSFEIGRVDDRMLTGNISNTFTEVEALKSINEVFPCPPELPNNFRLAFLKTTFYLAKAFKIDYRQNEQGRKLFNYCWATSDLINGYYIDPALDLYRCTYSVGAANFKVGNIRTGELINIFSSNQIFKDAQCINCYLLGYCSGGCTLTRSIDPERNCYIEKQAFNDFLNNFAKPLCRADWRRL